MGDTLVINTVVKQRVDFNLQSGQDLEFVIDMGTTDISGHVFSMVFRNNGVDFLTIANAVFTQTTIYKRSLIITKAQIESLSIGKPYTHYIDVILPSTLTEIWFYGNAITLPKDHD